jgi:polygalacturonase
MNLENNKSILGRRNFIGGAAAAFAGFTLLTGTRASGIDFSKNEGSLPVFNVLDFGLRGDGKTMNTVAVQKLIDGCSNSGGGTLFFPPGNYLTGSFRLKDNVNVYLSPGAKIRGSSNRMDYSHECLVYAEDAKNISIKGLGTIDGNGTAFWEDYMKGEVSFEDWQKNNWRPGRMFLFIRCENLRMHDFTIENSPSWTIHPVDCDRVTITGISILNGIYEEDGPNTDGINPDGCSRVIISDCFIQCGDDCIVLKITERSATKVCRDVVVTNCVLVTTETALKIGTETHGEFKNISFSNCTINDSGGGIGLIMRDGGFIDGVTVSNITIDSNRITHGQGIFIWSHRRNDNTPWGMIRNVIISNVTMNTGGSIFISGNREKYIEGLTIDNIRINLTGGRKEKSHNQPEDPFFVFGHHTAPVDIFCRYVNDLKLRSINFKWGNAEKENLGSVVRFQWVNELDIDGFTGRQSQASHSPVFSLKNVNGAFFHNCRLPEKTGTVLQLDKNTRDVSLIGNDFGRAKKLVNTAEEYNSIYETGNKLPILNND